MQSYDEAEGDKAFRYAWYQLRFCIKNSVLSVKSLVEGKLSKNDVAGPVGMAQIVDQVKTAAEPGGPMLVFMNMVNLAMLLSVSLGVMNLLPAARHWTAADWYFCSWRYFVENRSHRKKKASFISRALSH